MKRIIPLIIIFSIALSTKAIGLEVGKWTFVETDEYCYIGSLAIETDLPEEKKRGDNYILVYKNLGAPETVIQIEAGYDYNTEEKINVKIDKVEYPFYSTKDLPSAAWTDDDNKVIYAMKKGLKLVISGKSSRGTVTNDTYTLKGFTSSYTQLLEDC